MDSVCPLGQTIGDIDCLPRRVTVGVTEFYQKSPFPFLSLGKVELYLSRAGF